MDSLYALKGRDMRRGSAPIAQLNLSLHGRTESNQSRRKAHFASQKSVSDAQLSPLSDSHVASIPEEDDVEFAKGVLQRKFSVSSPMIKRAAKHHSHSMTAINRSQQPKILILAQDKDRRAITQITADESWSCEVVFTSSTAEATSKFFSDSSIRLAICWESMPDIDSVVFFQSISDALSSSSIEAIAILPLAKQTLKVDIPKRDELVSLGALDVIIAPFHPNLLRKRLQGIFSQNTSLQNSSIQEESTDSEVNSLRTAVAQKDFVIDDLRQKVKSLCFRVVLLDKEKQLKEDKKDILSQKLKEKEAELDMLRKSQNPDMDSDIENMKSKLENVFETPVQSLINLLEKLSSGNYTEGELQSCLVSSIRAIGSSDLYAPRFKRLLSDSTLDSMTRSWIKQEFTPNEEKDKEAESDDSSDAPTEQEGEDIADNLNTNEDDSDDISDKIADSADQVQESTDTYSESDEKAQSGDESHPNSLSHQDEAPHQNPRKNSQDSRSSPLKQNETPKSTHLLPFATPGTFQPPLRTDIFDVLVHSEEELCVVAEQIFVDLQLFDKYQIKQITFRNFMEAVRQGYHSNPYHNFQHAVDVLHSCYLILTTTNATEYLTMLDVFALAFSALCHDIDHPGVNNNFLITCQNPVALLYNDQAVLENHHCYRAFMILKNPECNIASGLTGSEMKEFRKMCVYGILSTDMAKHFEHLAKLNTHVQTKPFSRESMEDRLLLVGTVLHMADLGNATRPPTVSKNWSERVMAEFLLQGDAEKEYGMPISPYMDRHETDPAKMSLNFLDFIAIPLVEAVSALLPDFLYAYRNIKENRNLWADIHKLGPMPLPVKYESYDQMVIGLRGDSFWKNALPDTQGQSQQDSSQKSKLPSGARPETAKRSNSSPKLKEVNSSKTVPRKLASSPSLANASLNTSLNSSVNSTKGVPASASPRTSSISSRITQGKSKQSALSVSASLIAKSTGPVSNSPSPMAHKQSPASGPGKVQAVARPMSAPVSRPGRRSATEQTTLIAEANKLMSSTKIDKVPSSPSTPNSQRKAAWR
eukprot:TRINITY_DN2391_c0_g2_i1.p1 TRINITY_DN2391_c0_g2~~TRINITY_DN2391_c0_g2_i1.p1  ORF type:complete len:1044 (-),score=216.96 TRINITY_DN2391_c0_g2_i1:2509-5640(-)